MLKNKNVKKDIAEDEKMIAEKLNEAISKAEEEKEEDKEKENEDLFIFDELKPEEELSFGIAAHLSAMVAERFEPIAEAIGMEATKKLVVRIENTDPATAVNMLQAMFLSNGMVHAAEELDILDYCSEYDVDVYNDFIDCLFDTDIFDWYSIESLFDEFRKEDKEKQCEREVDIWQRL